MSLSVHSCGRIGWKKKGVMTFKDYTTLHIEDGVILIDGVSPNMEDITDLDCLLRIAAIPAKGAEDNGPLPDGGKSK